MVLGVGGCGIANPLIAIGRGMFGYTEFGVDIKKHALYLYGNNMKGVMVDEGGVKCGKRVRRDAYPIYH